MFDPDTFMNQPVEGAFSTEIKLPKEGEAQAMIDDFDNDKAFRTVQIGKGARAGTEVTIFVCPFLITDEGVKAELGRERVVITKDFWLDLDASGRLDNSEGKNVDLGRLRKALGQNDGQWTFAQLKNAGPLMVKISHESYQQDGETRKKAVIGKFAPISR